jgi:hypothetical protein
MLLPCATNHTLIRRSRSSAPFLTDGSGSDVSLKRPTKSRLKKVRISSRATLEMLYMASHA